jgi:hypothetical protein
LEIEFISTEQNFSPLGENVNKVFELLLDRVMKTMETTSLPGNMLLNIYGPKENGNGTHENNKRVKLDEVNEVDEDDDDQDIISGCKC